MLAEGYAPGSSTLVAGPSGAGKTLMGLHFIFSGAASGEPGVIASLQENPIQLQKVAGGFGWSLDNERVAVMYRSPNDVYIDEWVYELLDLIERTGARRVLIDSLSDLQYAAPDPVRFREFIYSLMQRLSRAGISPIMTSEIPDLFHVGRLAEYGISHLSDNVILLQYLRAEHAPAAHGDDPQVTRQRPRARNPRVRHHPGRDRPRRSNRRRPRLSLGVQDSLGRHRLPRFGHSGQDGSRTADGRNSFQASVSAPRSQTPPSPHMQEPTHYRFRGSVCGGM